MCQYQKTTPSLISKADPRQKEIKQTWLGAEALTGRMMSLCDEGGAGASRWAPQAAQ